MILIGQQPRKINMTVAGNILLQLLVHFRLAFHCLILVQEPRCYPSKMANERLPETHEWCVCTSDKEASTVFG